MARKRKTVEHFIQMGTVQPRAVFASLEALVTWGEENPYFYDGMVLRYVEGEAGTTTIGTFSTVKESLKSAESHQ